MASGSQSMTTYYAKRIVGDASAAQANSALLQTGANVVVDTWILNRTNRVNTYGIKYVYDDTDGHDKVEFYGGAATASAWVQLDTGNITAPKFIGALEGNADSATALTSNAGGTEQPIYFTGGKPAVTSYALKATVNNGTEAYLAYYSGEHAISSWSAAKFHDGCLSLFPTTGSYREGLRIHTTGSWSDITLCGNDNTGDSGTSANSWFLGNNNGNFYIARNGSPGSTAWLECVNNIWSTMNPIWIKGGSTEAGTNANRLTTSSGTPGNMQYNSSHRGVQIYSNGIAFADPYNGNSNNDAGWIRHLETSANSAEFEIAVGDDGNEPIYVRQYNTSNAVARQIALLTASGNTTIPGSFYFGGDGIYHSGTAATQRIIRIIDSGDQYGTGISIGAGGLALFGSGESASTVISNLSLTAGGTETTYITSDNSIEFYPSINGWDAAARIWMTAGVLNIGVDGNTTRENSLNVYSGAGRLQLYSAASKTGNRGLWVPAHGSGSAKNIILIDTNNNATFTGNVTGNAATATTASQCSSAALTDIALTWSSSYSTGSWMLIYNDEKGSNGGALFRAINQANTAAWVDGAHKWVRIGGDDMTGSIRQKMTNVTRGSTPSANQYRTYEWIDNGNKRVAQVEYGMLTSGESRLHLYVLGNNTTSTGDEYGGIIIYKKVGISGNVSASYNANNGTFTATKVYNAVWNDYAECRQAESIEPGRVFTESTSGIMKITTKRLMPACKISSDTFGTCMGETSNAKTPIAVAGRVLVYPYRARAEYELGAAVCSAPNGTVDIMTREEIHEYPERIIGTVSEIPDYEVWHAGERDGKSDVQVNGRIWIYVR